MIHLVHFADPMCAWCYGFGPQLSLVMQRLALHEPVGIELAMGGLRADHKDVMDQESKFVLLEHWKAVHELSGLPFVTAAIDADGFVYNTEPACRAVVAVRQIDPNRALAMFHAVQNAFFGEGRNTTREDVLAFIAERCGIKRGPFLETFRAPATRDATRADFYATERVGVTGFPTLCVMRGKQLNLLSAGYATADEILAAWAALPAEASA